MFFKKNNYLESLAEINKDKIVCLGFAQNNLKRGTKEVEVYKKHIWL